MYCYHISIINYNHIKPWIKVQWMKVNCVSIDIISWGVR